MNPFIYIIPVAVILIIFVISFASARKKAAQYNANVENESHKTPNVEEKVHKDRIYEVKGINQISDHPLGAVQSTIRGRIRFVLFGLILIGVALMGMYLIFVAKLDVFEAGNAWYIRLVEAVLLLGAVGWGLQLFYFATCKIKLRRLGFEMCSILGSKAYEYTDAQFNMFESIEHRTEGNGYRSMVKKTQNFNWIWVCQIIVKSQHKLIEVKSSRYAWLHHKMFDLMQALD